MSYFIPNSIKYQDNTIWLKGGDNNVFPRSNEWTNYPAGENHLLLWNLLDGGVQPNGTFERSNLGQKVIKAAAKVKRLHKERFPKCDEEHGIGTFGFYRMRIVFQCSKEELRQAQDEVFERWRESSNAYYKEDVERYNFYLENYEEFRKHFKKMHQVFQKETGIILDQRQKPAEQLELFA